MISGEGETPAEPRVPPASGGHTEVSPWEASPDGDRVSVVHHHLVDGMRSRCLTNGVCHIVQVLAETRRFGAGVLNVEGGSPMDLGTGRRQGVHDPIAPDVDNVIVDRERNIEYHVVAYRKLTVSEMKMAVAVYRGQAKRLAKKNCRVTIHTIIGHGG